MQLSNEGTVIALINFLKFLAGRCKFLINHFIFSNYSQLLRKVSTSDIDFENKGSEPPHGTVLRFASDHTSELSPNHTNSKMINLKCNTTGYESAPLYHLRGLSFYSEVLHEHEKTSEIMFYLQKESEECGHQFSASKFPKRLIEEDSNVLDLHDSGSAYKHQTGTNKIDRHAEQVNEIGLLDTAKFNVDSKLIILSSPSVSDFSSSSANDIKDLTEQVFDQEAEELDEICNIVRTEISTHPDFVVPTTETSSKDWLSLPISVICSIITDPRRVVRVTFLNGSQSYFPLHHFRSRLFRSMHSSDPFPELASKSGVYKILPSKVIKWMNLKYGANRLQYFIHSPKVSASAVHRRLSRLQNEIV